MIHAVRIYAYIYTCSMNRSFILANLDNFKATPEFIHFLSSLSLHCFTNEYIYIEKDEDLNSTGDTAIYSQILCEKIYQKGIRDKFEKRK